MSDFGPARVRALKVAIARAAGGVSPDNVAITITPASVKVVAIIRMPGTSSSAAQARARTLVAELRTPALASAALGVAVVGRPVILDLTLPLTPSTPAAGLPTAVLVVAVAAALAVLCVGYYCHRRAQGASSLQGKPTSLLIEKGRGGVPDLQTTPSGRHDHGHGLQLVPNPTSSVLSSSI